MRITLELSKNERLTAAIETAQFAFWAAIARSYPEVSTGDYQMEDITVTCRPLVEHWLELNKPKTVQTCSVENFSIIGKTLHYENNWHIVSSSETNKIAITDNVLVNEKQYYLAVNSECVSIYEDTFKQDDFLKKSEAFWILGDNPTVLINAIDEYMGGERYWNIGKLFDDIMTIAKSGLV